MLLQKEDPDGYYEILKTPKESQVQNAPVSKITTSGEIYKIWGEINANRQIVNIDKVEWVETNSKAPKAQTPQPAPVVQTTLAPKNINNFQKTDSAENTTFCDLPSGIITYMAPNSPQEMALRMTVHNRNNTSDTYYQSALSKLDRYFNGSTAEDDRLNLHYFLILFAVAMVVSLSKNLLIMNTLKLT